MRFRLISVSALVITVAAIVAGCGGGGSVPSGSTIGTTPQPQPSTGAPATLHVTITVGGSGSAKRVRPGYVSSNTQSVAIQLVSSNGSPVSGQPATIVQTYAGAPGCTASGSTLTCTQDITTISGQDVFAVTLFSAPNGTGAALASGFITSTVSPGGGSLPITNSTSLALSGIVANISVSVVPASFTFGVPGSAQVILNATDASGATIIAPGTFSSPIQLTTTDQSNSFGFTTPTTTTPSASLSVTSPGTAIALVYNGSTNASGPVVVTATLGSLQATAQVQLTVPVTPTPSGSPSPAPSGLIYVLNAGSSGSGLGSGASVTEYQANASGNATPVRTLNLNNPATANLYAAGMTVDSAGNLYIGYYDTAPVFDTYQVDGGDEIAMYAPGASGSAAPSSTLLSVTDPNQNQVYLDPGLIFVDTQGRLNTLGDDGAMGFSLILTYPKPATGAIQPSNSFAFSFSYPVLGAFSYYGGSTNGYTSGFTEDAAGNLYMTGSFYFNGNNVGTVEVAPSNFISDPSQGSVPSRYFTANSTTKLANDNLENGISSPHDIQGLALDASGTIYESQIVGGSHNASINVYANSGSGKINNPPLRTITSTAFPSVDPSTEVGIMPVSILGSSLYAVNRPGNSILVFPTSASGASSPSATISGSSTKLQSPMAIVVTTAGAGSAVVHHELRKR